MVKIFYSADLHIYRRNHVSLIFQSYNRIDYMTPIENVALTAKQDALPLLLRLGLTTEEAKRNCDETVRRAAAESGNRPRPGF